MWCFCINVKARVVYIRIYFLFFILGILCVVFLYQKSLLTRVAALINKLVFKKPNLQFFNLCLTISFIKFAAMIMLQILKSIKKF